MRFSALCLVGMILVAAGRGAGAAEPDAAAEDAIRKASAAYAEAYNKRDFNVVADQWAGNAELIEGGTRVVGRDAIVASIRGWLERHPQATLEIKVTAVDLVAAPLARVRGSMRFTGKPGAPPQETRFESLRVLEDGTWRLAESYVVPSHAAALEDLGWLVGTWQATDAKTGTLVEATFERALALARPAPSHRSCGRGAGRAWWPPRWVWRCSGAGWRRLWNAAGGDTAERKARRIARSHPCRPCRPGCPDVDSRFDRCLGGGRDRVGRHHAQP